MDSIRDIEWATARFERAFRTLMELRPQHGRLMLYLRTLEGRGGYYPTHDPKDVEVALRTAAFQLRHCWMVREGRTVLCTMTPGLLTSGHLGVVPLDSVPSTVELVLRSAGVGEGLVAAWPLADRADWPVSPFSTVVLAQEQGREILESFGPGDPTVASTVEGRLGQLVTPDCLRRQGVRHVRLEGNHIETAGSEVGMSV